MQCNQSPEEPRSTLNVEEVAADLDVCSETVRRLCRRGLLQRVMGIREIRIPRQAYQDFLANKFQRKAV